MEDADHVTSLESWLTSDRVDSRRKEVRVEVGVRNFHPT